MWFFNYDLLNSDLYYSFQKSILFRAGALKMCKITPFDEIFGWKWKYTYSSTENFNKNFLGNFLYFFYFCLYRRILLSDLSYGFADRITYIGHFDRSGVKLDHLSKDLTQISKLFNLTWAPCWGTRQAKRCARF